MNYYNDSLENDAYEENEEDENQENNKENNEVKEEKLDDNNNVEEIIDIKNDNLKKIKDDDVPISKDVLKIDEQKEQKIKTTIYKDNKKNDIEDKTSFCHSIIFEGEDVDITRKKIFECNEQTSTNLILFKKKSKSKRLIFFDEQFIYIIKDLNNNNNNINIINNNKFKRIYRRYDLSKLCNIELNNEKDEFKFSLHFLKNDYFEREVKYFYFQQEEGRIFYQQLADTIENIESSFFNDLFEYDDEEEKEEEEDEDNENKEEDENDIDMSAKHMNNINVIGDKNNDLDLISSSRKKIV